MSKGKIDLSYDGRYFFPALIALGYGSGYLLYLPLRGTLLDPYDSRLDPGLLFLLLACGAAPLVVFYKRAVNALFFLVELTLLLIILTLVENDLAITAILSATLILACGYYLRRPANLVLSLAAGAAVLLFQHPIAVGDAATRAIAGRELVMLGFLFLLVACFGYAVSSIVEAREALQARMREQDETIVRLVEANVGIQRFALDKKAEYEDAERLRITRDIHDTIGYVMTNNIMLLRACTYYVPKRLKKAHAFLGAALENVETGLNETRSVLKELRNIDRVPGPGGILRLVRLFNEATGVSVKCSFGNTAGSLGEELDCAFYRIVQEGLVNAVKHGKATEISIGFWRNEREIMLTIADNGAGGKAGDAGIGLAGMRERLAPFGGSLEARRYAHGFTLHVSVPAGGARRAAD